MRTRISVRLSTLCTNFSLILLHWKTVMLLWLVNVRCSAFATYSVLQASLSAAIHETRLCQTKVLLQAAYMLISEPPLIPRQTALRFWMPALSRDWWQRRGPERVQWWRMERKISKVLQGFQKIVCDDEENRASSGRDSALPLGVASGSSAVQVGWLWGELFLCVNSSAMCHNTLYIPHRFTGKW